MYNATNSKSIYILENRHQGNMDNPTPGPAPVPVPNLKTHPSASTGSMLLPPLGAFIILISILL